VLVGVGRHLELFSAARGPPETGFAGFEPQRPRRPATWTGSSLVKCSGSAGRRACNQLLSPLYQAYFYSTMRFFDLVVLLCMAPT
jgi:hypothetical protein